MMIYVCVTVLLSALFSAVISEDCGPLGYPAKNLLRPSYWYFDLGFSKCPPLPADSFVAAPRNITSCRIYFNLCKKLTYQCSGTVCVRYRDTDLVSLLGKYDKHPFTEPLKEDDFIADYIGERLRCKSGEVNIKTRFYFYCHENATWPIRISEAHGGSKAPDPLVSFDNSACQLTFKFNYTGACWTPGKHDSPVTNISNGTFVLILFFPSILLYFIMGGLFNSVRGKKGSDVIPHRELLEDLPELILDGFMFTAACVTCSHEDRFIHDYEQVGGS